MPRPPSTPYNPFNSGDLRYQLRCAQPSFQLHPSSFEGSMAAWGRQVLDTLWPQLSRTIAAVPAGRCRRRGEAAVDRKRGGVGM